jgi:hypothetical protein
VAQDDEKQFHSKALNAREDIDARDPIQSKLMAAENRQKGSSREIEALLDQYDEWEADGFSVYEGVDRELFRKFAAEQEARAVSDPRHPDAKAWKIMKAVRRQGYDLHVLLTRGRKRRA